MSLKSKAILGGFVAFIILAIILIIAIAKKTLNVGYYTPEEMLKVFNSLPDLDKYNYNASGSYFLLNVWQDPNFGGSIFNNVKTLDESKKYIEVPNNFKEKISNITVDAQKVHGYVKFKNV